MRELVMKQGRSMRSSFGGAQSVSLHSSNMRRAGGGLVGKDFVSRAGGAQSLPSKTSRRAVGVERARSIIPFGQTGKANRRRTSRYDSSSATVLQFPKAKRRFGSSLALPTLSFRGILDAVDNASLSALLLLVSIPVALIVIYFATVGIVPTLELMNRRWELSLPAADTQRLAGYAPSETEREPSREWASDARQFEQIRRTEYTIQAGDTLSEIALAHGLNVGTLISMNGIDDVRRLIPGTQLSIPDRDGLFHAIQPGDSLTSIASSYDVAVSAILDANDLDSSVLSVGEALFIPGAEMEETQYLLAIGELLRWPVSRFRFTSGYGMRVHPITGSWHMHTGIDLANIVGTPITAARAGRVVHVEDSSAAYGKMVIIDHGSGIRTLYGHLSAYLVQAGQYVGAGQAIGRMGNTGRSTGSHLHFSVIRNGRWEDPLKHLP
ncbi:MAG: peptidoglycan DD-metalloendopeptidase family protein [Spirochaetales bacterium]